MLPVLVMALTLCAATSCDKGLGNITTTYVSPYVPSINLHRPEDAQWFWDRFAAKADKPVFMLQTTTFQGFIPRAIREWPKSDERLRAALRAGPVEVLHGRNGTFSHEAQRTEMSFEAFLQRAASNSSLLMETAVPAALEADLRIQDPDIWKFLPCFHSASRSFASTRRLLMGFGGPQTSALVAAPHDLFVYVAAGQRKFLLYPPHTTFSANQTLRASTTFAVAEPPGSIMAYEVNLEAGQMLYVPFMWYRRAVSYCRHISVETHFDIRRLTAPPLLERLYRNEQLSAMDVFARTVKMDVPASGVCSELVAPRHFERRWRTWQWRATLLTGGMAAAVVLLVVYFVRAFRADEEERRAREAKQEESKKDR